MSLATLTELLGKYMMALASHLWQTLIVVIVLFALARSMRRAPAWMQNALWWVALGKLVLPFSIVAPTIRRALELIVSRAAPAGTGMEVARAVLDRAVPVLDPVSVVSAPVGGSLSLALVALAAAWSAGAVWLILSWMRALDRSTLSGAVPAGELPEPLSAALGAALVGTDIPMSAVLVTRRATMPSVVGILRRRIVISRELVSCLAPVELRAILLHEDAHRRRLEPLQALIQRVAMVLFYFFPPLWSILTRLRETSELACDECVTRRGVAPADYARALARTIDMSLEPVAMAPALARGGSTLTRRRLERLMSREGRREVKKLHWAVLALAVLTAIATAVSSAVPLALASNEAEGAADVTTEVATDAEGDQVVSVTVEADEESEEAQTYTITLKHSVDPEYPEDARRDGAGGRVTLELTISPDGIVSDVVALEEVEGYPSLAEAASDAASQWTFEINGEVVEGEHLEVIVPVEFRIDGKKTMELSVKIPDAEKKQDDEGPDESETEESASGE